MIGNHEDGNARLRSQENCASAGVAENVVTLVSITKAAISRPVGGSTQDVRRKQQRGQQEVKVDQRNSGVASCRYRTRSSKGAVESGVEHHQRTASVKYEYRAVAGRGARLCGNQALLREQPAVDRDGADTSERSPFKVGPVASIVEHHVARLEMRGCSLGGLGERIANSSTLSFFAQRRLAAAAVLSGRASCQVIVEFEPQLELARLAEGFARMRRSGSVERFGIDTIIVGRSCSGLEVLRAQAEPSWMN